MLLIFAFVEYHRVILEFLAWGWPSIGSHWLPSWSSRRWWFCRDVHHKDLQYLRWQSYADSMGSWVRGALRFWRSWFLSLWWGLRIRGHGQGTFWRALRPRRGWLPRIADSESSSQVHFCEWIQRSSRCPTGNLVSTSHLLSQGKLLASWRALLPPSTASQSVFPGSRRWYRSHPWSCESAPECHSRHTPPLPRNLHASSKKLSHSSLGLPTNLIQNYLSCGKHDQELDLPAVPEGILLPESLDDWKREGEGLSWACPIAGDEVSALEDVLEGIILNGEEAFDALFLEYLDHFLILDEVRKIALLMEFSLIYLDCLWVGVLQQLTAWFLEFRYIVLSTTLCHSIVEL